MTIIFSLKIFNKITPAKRISLHGVDFFVPHPREYFFSIDGIDCDLSYFVVFCLQGFRSGQYGSNVSVTRQLTITTWRGRCRRYNGGKVKLIPQVSRYETHFFCPLKQCQSVCPNMCTSISKLSASSHIDIYFIDYYLYITMRCSQHIDKSDHYIK